MAKTIARGKGWSIKVTNEGALNILGDAPEAVSKQMAYAMRDIAHDIPAEVVKRMSNFKPGQRSAKSPQMIRTGALAKTVQGRPQGRSLSDIRAIITAGSAQVPYARVQEYGTVGAGGTLPDIKPKNKYLRMPLSSILTGSGAVKGEYELVERGGQWQTAGGNPTWISGRAIMIEENGTPRPIWALMTESKIPPRLGIGTTIANNDKWIRDQLLDAVDRAVGKS
mgnify:CR=1 FL=1